jgi:hypothetical protein
MDHKSIVLYLHREGWTALVIYDDLAATLGEKAIAYIRATKYLREVQINPSDPTLISDTTPCPIDDSDSTILEALDILSFAIARHFSDAMHRPVLTVYRRLFEKLGCARHHLR